MRFEAEIIKQHLENDNTGMIHLCPVDGSGIIRKHQQFPIGTKVQVEAAHWYGNIRVYRAYLPDGDFDYFEQSEVRLTEVDPVDTCVRCGQLKAVHPVPTICPKGFHQLQDFEDGKESERL